MKKAVYGKPQILEAEQDFNRLPDSEKQNAYGELVEQLIRKKYSLSAELAILRQRDEKPEEFAAYNAYAEQCKVNAKAVFVPYVPGYEIAGGVAPDTEVM